MVHARGAHGARNVCTCNSHPKLPWGAIKCNCISLKVVNVAQPWVSKRHAAAPATENSLKSRNRKKRPNETKSENPKYHSNHTHRVVGIHSSSNVRHWKGLQWQRQQQHHVVGSFSVGMRCDRGYKLYSIFERVAEWMNVHVIHGRQTHLGTNNRLHFRINRFTESWETWNIIKP